MALFLRTLLLSLSISLSASFALAQKMEGVLMVVKGDIKVISKDGAATAAKVGKKVFQGDTIVAGADSRAKVVMADKNVLNISPDSKVMIEKYENDGKDNKNVELNVLYGKVRASVEQKYDGEKSKFNVKTPSAVAGVRGTDFITGYSPQTKQTSITTFSGAVAVGQPGPGGSIVNPVFVQKGQTTNASAGGVEPPKPVPAEELNKMNQESSADTASSKQTNEQSVAKSDEKKEEETKEDAKQEQASKEEGKKDDAKKEEAKKEDGAKEEPKKEQASNKEEPKKDEPKKDDAKKEPVAAKEEPKKEGSKNESNNASNSSTSANGDRAPASDKSSGSSNASTPTTAAPAITVKREDLPGGPGGNMIIPKPVTTAPTISPVRLPAASVVTKPPATNNFITETVKNSKSRVNVILKPSK